MIFLSCNKKNQDIRRKKLFTRVIIRSFVCNMKRPSVKQSVKQQVSSNFQIYPWGVKLMIDPPISKSQTATTALHCIQLYMLSSFLCCHLELSYWTGQSYIYYFRIYLSIYSCCCAFDCILLLLFLLLLLCITQQKQG